MRKLRKASFKECTCRVISTTIGSYPRPPWFISYLRKIEGLQKEGGGEVDKAIYSKAVAEVIHEQREAGVKLFTDGQLLWHDLLCHLATKIDGFEMNGLVRYFDNNLYYRIPRVKAKLERRRSIVADEFRVAYDIEREMKAVLSCFTLASLSEDEFYHDKSEFVMDLAHIINQEAKELVKNGAKYIQIDEPSLLYAEKEDLNLMKDAIEVIRRGVDAKFFLVTYFRDAERIFPEVLDYNIDVLGLDFVEGYEKNLELLREYSVDKEVQAGVVDGRTTKMENERQVREKIEAICEVINGKTLYVSPNTGLEFLPYSKASEKLKALCSSVGGADE